MTIFASTIGATGLYLLFVWRGLKVAMLARDAAQDPS